MNCIKNYYFCLISVLEDFGFQIKMSSSEINLFYLFMPFNNEIFSKRLFIFFLFTSVISIDIFSPFIIVDYKDEKKKIIFTEWYMDT